MKTSRRLLGDRGEAIASRYLSEKGLSVIERNWRKGHLELDIVALGADGLHFVEVKSRTAPLTADPLAGITPTKRNALVRAAGTYLKMHPCGDIEILFDIVTVVFDGEDVQLHYYPRAFIPIYL